MTGPSLAMAPVKAEEASDDEAGEDETQEEQIPGPGDDSFFKEAMAAAAAATQ